MENEPEYTHLWNGRIRKDHLRNELVGTLDEAMAFIGLAANKTQDVNFLHEVVDDIGKVTSICACDKIPAPVVDGGFIDGSIICWQKISNPTGFIKFRGEAASYLNVARTKIRTAEIMAVTLYEKKELDVGVVTYLNKMSKLLFLVGAYYCQMN